MRPASRAMTMIEVLASLVLLSALTVGASGWLTGQHRLSVRSAEVLSSSLGTQRVLETIGRDVRQAAPGTVRVSENLDSISLVTTNQAGSPMVGWRSVTWSVSGGSLVRQERVRVDADESVRVRVSVAMRDVEKLRVALDESQANALLRVGIGTARSTSLGTTIEVQQ